jgi:acetyl-CoA carboxylase biotin carboxyl carrier protein
MLTHEDVEEILRLLDATPVEEFELETERFKLTLRRSPAGHGGWTQERQTRGGPDLLVADNSNAAQRPSAADGSAKSATSAPSASAAHPGVQFEIRAPLVGTFYRSPKPGAPPFVDIGTEVRPDTVVAIIETMKLMNSVYAGAAGRVAQICIDDGGLIEQHQVLMRLAPAAS